MPYKNKWELTTERIGQEERVSSPKGYFILKKNRFGRWVINGEVVAGTTDCRELVKKMEMGKYETTTVTPMTSPLGKFEKDFNSYLEARLYGKEMIAVVPARVPFSRLGETTAEAKRDQAFFQKQLTSYKEEFPHEEEINNTEDGYKKMLHYKPAKRK